MFVKAEYIRSEKWMGNDYLVQPDTAVKRCWCCDKLFYSVEFPDVEEAVDGKLLVCLSCFRSIGKKKKVDSLLSEWGVTRMCRKCEREFPADEFRSYIKAKNRIDNVCQECKPVKPDFWNKEKGGDED